MGFYDSVTSSKRMQSSGERLFYAQHQGAEGFTVKVDGKFDRDVIIKKHSNPLKDQSKDLKLFFLNTKDNTITMGSQIEGYMNNEKYIVIAEPNSNGITSTCKIRRLENQVKFVSNGKEISTYGILANGLLYSDRAYLDDGNIFEQYDKKALVVQYNDITSKLELFDEMIVDDNQYKIVQIDDCTLKNHEDKFGVLQVVLIDTQFGSIKKNSEATELKCVLRYARVKDKIQNSKSREIMTGHNTIKTGDYIRHIFNRDDNSTVTEERVYLVRSMIDMYNKYDSAICYNCDVDIKLLDNKGNIVTTPAYMEDNRARIDKTSETANTSLLTSSYMFTVQENDITSKLLRKVHRVIIKGDAYRLTGKDGISMNGIITFGMEIDKVDTNNDLYDVADYKTQMKEISEEISQDEINGNGKIIVGRSGVYKIATSCDWTVNGDAKLEIISGNECKVVVANNTDMIGKSVVLSANLGNRTATKQIQIVGW